MSKRFEDLKRVHVLGVCGTLMGAFACFLKRAGVEVTGSDEHVYPPMSDVLKNAGIAVYSGYSPKNISNTPSPDLIVIGNVIRRDNPEAVAARSSAIPTVSLPEFMETWLLPDTHNIVVAGTHGKTTTSSVLSFVLMKYRRPSFFVGGVSQDLPHSFHVEQARPTEMTGPPLFVLEGDEYDTAFWDKVPKFNHYLPNDVILTSCEFDHADIYADLAAVVRAFEGLLSRIRPGGKLILCTDYPSSSHLLEVAQSLGTFPILTYGTKKSEGLQPRYFPENIRTETHQGVECTKFDVMEEGKRLDTVHIQLPGVHNVLNCVAVWLECRELGLTPAQIREGLRSFRGVKRRQEERGTANGVLIIDDFAHHPTAVRETLAALKERYRGRRLIAVFEPRSATSRRKVFQKDYIDAFGKADVAFIAQPYAPQAKTPVAGQAPDSGSFSSAELVADVKKKFPAMDVETFETVDAGVARVSSHAKPGDVVAVLSNGGFGGFIAKLMKALAE